MADEVQIFGPDGVSRTTVIFSTTLQNRFFTGTLPTDAIEFQVSLNGSSFSADPSYALWSDGTWTVPSPLFEPNGLALLTGINTVKVRALLASGAVTGVATATVRLISDSDAGVVASAPTNVSVEQEDTLVRVRAESSAAEGFQGMNFHASVDAGGGVSGYTRINVNLVSSGTDTQEETEFATLDVDSDILVDGDGVPVADPMFFRMTGAQQDEDTVVLQSDFDQEFEIPETARKLRVSSAISSIRDVTIYDFEHSRTAGGSSTPATVRVGAFTSLPIETPLYYVVTAVFYDETQNIEYESVYSEEVVGRPVGVTTALGAFPVVSRKTIGEQFAVSIFRSNPQVKIEAGSVLRDTVIDPFSSESERVRFLLDFYHRARTPTLLLQIDDPDGSGVSVPVANSPYKLALQGAFFLSSTTLVQSIIDSAFEAYASNFGKRRRSGVSSRGEVTFYTTRRPTASILIPLGTIVSGGGVQFVTTRAASIDFSDLGSFYDPVSGRYSVTVPVRASTTGSSGNIGLGQVTSIVTSLAGSMSVINTSKMKGGLDQESNLSLVVRVQNALASVDSGTARGYQQTAADVAGVIKANVVSAGDDLMMRDLDSDGVHRGGKVDVWVQGENAATATDSFAFSFEIGHDIQFELIGNPSDLIFRALDTNLSSSNPIVEMLDDSLAGFEFLNVSTGEAFDLTGVTITSFDTIQLSADVTQPAVDLTDVVLGSYRRRAGNIFTLLRQPVTSITSVVGTVSGALAEGSFTLVHPNSPLAEGRSTLAGDYLSITSYTDDDDNLVPSGDTISVTGEAHVLIGQYPEPVNNLGANYLTVKVWDADHVIEYKGPNDPSGDPDYEITLGTQTTALTITRTLTGDIPTGASVLVEYEHDENFEITYQVNLIVSLTQEALDEKKHVTADVVAKDAIPAPLDVEATVVLKKGAARSTVETALLTNFANFYANLRMGDPVRQSDLIRIIEGTAGVSYVVVPFSKMVRSEGSTVTQDAMSTDTAAESIFVQTYSTNKASVYLLVNGLSAATTDGGGADGEFKGVFQDDIALELLDASSSLSALGSAPGRAYILGSEGRSITGISDDATLIAAGHVTAAAIQARREEITANHVLVSVAVGSSPQLYSYVATYVVGEDTGAKDIVPSAAEYIKSGTVLFTYDEDR